MNSLDDLKNIQEWKEEAKGLQERNRLVTNIQNAILFGVNNVIMSLEKPLTDDELDELARNGVDVVPQRSEIPNITYKFIF